MFEDINLEENVFLMSMDSWIAFKEQEFDIADSQPDPISYLLSFCSMSVVIDNNIDFGIAEMWNLEDFNEYIELNGLNELVEIDEYIRNTDEHWDE